MLTKPALEALTDQALSADVIAWLRSPEGEQWSRDRALADPVPIVIMRPWWRARGPLPSRHDPCGRPPEKSASAPRRTRG